MAQKTPATFASAIFVGLLLSACTNQTASVVPVSSDQAPLPRTHELVVPFTPQAPHANWDDPYQEACEEAALIMAHYFLTDTDADTDAADADLLDLIHWETDQGYAEDITLVQLGEVAQEYYGYDYEIVDNPSVEDLKQLIADGHPIVVPAAGRELGNPYFSGEGPWYHMLVITGYTPRHFITNDPGTRRGEGYKYKYNTLMNAIHDWNGQKEAIGGGAKRVMIVSSSQPAG